MTAVRTLVLWVPDWPVVAAGAAPVEPAAVVRANRVLAVTPGARAEGVEVGMRRREAQGRCPELAVLEHDPARDARAFEPLVAALADRVTPRIEVAAPGHAALPTRGPSRYFGGDAALAALVAELAAGVLAGRAVAQVGVADGPFAALLAARAAPAHPAPVLVPPLCSPRFLAEHPVDALALAGFAPELLDVLRRLGLRTLGAVAALPPGDVAGRFGADGVALHRLASGRDERPPATEPPPPELAARAELDPPAERVETAAFVARGLADELARRLDDRGIACTRLLVAAETEHGERLERLWRGDGAGGAAALSAGAIADRIRWQLDGWLRGPASGPGARPTAGIALLELVPDEVTPAVGRQLGFWGGSGGMDERAARAVARVAGLLGPEAVVVPEWRGGRSPAEVVATVPAAAVDLGDERPSARPPSARSPSARPLGDDRPSARPPAAGPLGDDRPSARPPSARPPSAAPTTAAPATAVAPWPGALPAPLPVDVPVRPIPVELEGRGGGEVRVTGRGLLTGEPARLRVGGERARWSTVAAWAGPWPVEERWWDPERSRRRARLQVLDTDGVAHLLAVEGGRWWLEATYD